MANETNAESLQQKTAEVERLKRVVAGLKGANKQLGDKVEKYKGLCSEGDAINEKRIGELEEKESVIRGLNEQVMFLKRAVAERDEKIDRLKMEKDDIAAKLEKATRKWWKNIL